MNKNELVGKKTFSLFCCCALKKKIFYFAPLIFLLPLKINIIKSIHEGNLLKVKLIDTKKEGKEKIKDVYRIFPI